MRTRRWFVIGLLAGSFLTLLVGCRGQLPPEGTLPVYNVTQGSVVTPGAAAQLAAALGIPGENILDADGGVHYLDEVKFLAVPMQGVVASLRTTGDEGPTGPMEAFDFAAIGRLPAISEARALSLVAGALAAANLTPSNLGISTLAATPGVSFAHFEAFDAGEVKVADARLDGQVSYAIRLDGTPLIGPGALVQVSLNGVETPTQVAYALRGLQKGANVPVTSSAQAAEHARALFLAANATATPSAVEYQCDDLVYYAPPLSLRTVTRVFPHYGCAGTATVGVAPQQVEAVQLLQYFVPAVNDVPVAVLTAAMGEELDSGFLLTYTVTVTGGTAPYAVTISSGTTDYLEEVTVPATASGRYPVYPYSFKTEEPYDFERVTISVTDANGLLGVPVSRDVTFPNDAVMARFAPQLAPLVGGVRDVGITRGVCDMGAGIHSGFRNRMVQDGVMVRFSYACQDSWERDFRENGLDPIVVDNVDMTLYIGHGWPGGFTFDNTSKDKGRLFHNEPAGVVRWGNQDLEWLALVSCQVLAQNSTGSGGQWYQRWAQEFDGLHLLLGFHTNASDWSGFGHRFADWMLGRRIATVTLPPVPVRAAWFQAAKEQQPTGTVAAVMGVFGRGGVTNYNDYFHGKGPVGPDIRGSDITGWWYLRGP
jgi:hypothetical protein